MAVSVATPTRNPNRSRYGQVFAIREFGFIFAAHAVSMLGTVIADISLSILILRRTGSPFLAALSFAVGFLPYIFAGTLLAGIADRFPARTLLVTCNAASTALVALMALPGQPVWALMSLRVAASTIQPVFTSARAASLPEVLDPDRYPLGRSLLRMVNQGAQVLGFAGGGLLLLAMAPRTALWIDAGSFAVSAVLLRYGTSARPSRSRAWTGRISLVRDSLSGLAELWRLPRVRSLMLLWWTAPAFAAVPEGLAAPYAREIGSGSGGAGILMAAAALGTIGGEAAIALLAGPAWRSRAVIPLAGCSLIPLLGFATCPGAGPAALLMSATGAADAYMIGLDQLFVDAVPDRLRGTAFSINLAGIMLTQSIAMSLGGAAAQFIDPHVVIAGSAVLGTGLILLVGRSIRRSSNA
ncbi:MAG: MFS transporter [Catenulispora sp.]|nr:MFS transporter [Catenulispora sp.]